MSNLKECSNYKECNLYSNLSRMIYYRIINHLENNDLKNNVRKRDNIIIVETEKYETEAIANALDRLLNHEFNNMVSVTVINYDYDKLKSNLQYKTSIRISLKPIINIEEV